MKISYFRDTDALYVEFREADAVATRALDENTVLDIYTDGDIIAMTVEHASNRTDRQRPCAVSPHNMWYLAVIDTDRSAPQRFQREEILLVTAIAASLTAALLQTSSVRTAQPTDLKTPDRHASFLFVTHF